MTIHVNDLNLGMLDDGYAVLDVLDGTGHASEVRVFPLDSIHLRVERVSGFDVVEEIVKVSERFENVQGVVFCSPSGKPLFCYHA